MDTGTPPQPRRSAAAEARKRKVLERGSDRLRSITAGGRKVDDGKFPDTADVKSCFTKQIRSEEVRTRRWCAAIREQGAPNPRIASPENTSVQESASSVAPALSAIEETGAYAGTANRLIQSHEPSSSQAQQADTPEHGKSCRAVAQRTEEPPKGRSEPHGDSSSKASKRSEAWAQYEDPSCSFPERRLQPTVTGLQRTQARPSL